MNFIKIKTSPSVIIRIFLWFIMIVGGSIYAFYLDKDSAIFYNLTFHVFTAIVGLLILKFAFHAASTGGKELAKGRTSEMPRLETNKLITTGIYSCMRHPMLFGLTLLPLGWALLLGSPSFITIIAPLEMLFIVVMVIIFEEMEVKKKFGKEYQIYSQKVPMVSFKIKCLKKLFWD